MVVTGTGGNLDFRYLWNRNPYVEKATMMKRISKVGYKANTIGSINFLPSNLCTKASDTPEKLSNLCTNASDTPEKLTESIVQDDEKLLIFLPKTLSIVQDDEKLIFLPKT